MKTKKKISKIQTMKFHNFIVDAIDVCSAVAQSRAKTIREKLEKAFFDTKKSGSKFDTTNHQQVQRLAMP